MSKILKKYAMTTKKSVEISEKIGCFNRDRPTSRAKERINRHALLEKDIKLLGHRKEKIVKESRDFQVKS